MTNDKADQTRPTPLSPRHVSKIYEAVIEWLENEDKRGYRYMEQAIGRESEPGRRANDLLDELCQIDKDNSERRADNPAFFVNNDANMRTVKITQELLKIGHVALVFAASIVLKERRGEIAAVAMSRMAVGIARDCSGERTAA